MFLAVLVFQKFKIICMSQLENGHPELKQNQIPHILCKPIKVLGQLCTKNFEGFKCGCRQFSGFEDQDTT